MATKNAMILATAQQSGTAIIAANLKNAY